MEELAVGTRVEHPRYGEGIVQLTTFNILFADKEHYFVGAKS